jgi:GNAT superfamily N-acetyltransferase
MVLGSVRRMRRDAVHMRLDCAIPPTSLGTLAQGVEMRTLERRDETELARLMWLAFQDRVDDGYDNPAAAAAEAAGTLTGKWGPVIWEASVIAEADGRAIAAAVVVQDEAHAQLPLLAFAMTEPNWQHRGIGRRLIEDAVGRLAAIGVDALHLAVTRGNPARCLYERLGFQVVDQE